jgi:hypothetical protein
VEEPVSWPNVEIDSVMRLRALAAGLPHVALLERVFDAPVEAVWGIVGDLEGGVPRFEGGVSAIEILRRDGEEIELMSRNTLGISIRFRAVLRPGWCVMHARAADIGMAAVATRDGRTLFAHFEGSRWLGRLGKPLFRHNVRSDFARLEHLLRQRD